METGTVSSAVARANRSKSVVSKHIRILDGGRSVIDAYAFPMIRWAAAKLPDGLKDIPNVQALHDRLAVDPAVQRVLAREQIG